MLGNQYPSTSSLERDLESDEEDGTVLTAKIGTKWKKVQVGELFTGILVSHNILKEVHIRKCNITEAHRQLKTKNFV